MPASLRRDLEAVLAHFVAGHRGLRLGRLFGQPAAYAGRRAFARVTARGIEVKLPPAARDGAIRRGAVVRATVRGRGDAWTLLRADRSGSIGGSWLELAARHAAETLLTSAAEGR